MKRSDWGAMTKPVNALNLKFIFNPSDSGYDNLAYCY
jgi:hypothetical protein